jgi:hypothetical protein
MMGPGATGADIEEVIARTAATPDATFRAAIRAIVDYDGAPALAALDKRQIAMIEHSSRIVALDIPTIESAGGSVRCMLAGLHLAKRNSNSEKSPK